MWSFHSGGLEAHASCRRLCIPTLSGIVEVDLVGDGKVAAVPGAAIHTVQPLDC